MAKREIGKERSDIKRDRKRKKQSRERERENKSNDEVATPVEMARRRENVNEKGQ